VRRHAIGELNNKDDPMPNAMDFYTNMGMMRFICLDVDDIHTDADCAIIMFDKSNPKTFRSVHVWYDYIRTNIGDVPIVLCGNKVDLPTPTRKINSEIIKFKKKNNIWYYDISVKSRYNAEKPFFYFLKQLCKNPDLLLMEIPYMEKKENHDMIMARL
jgi:GTP-binding nuclear protein Ran